MYSQICQNISEIEDAIDLIEVDLRRYISIDKVAFEYKYTKLLSYLITCWTKVRILKVANERSAFTPAELNNIKSTNTLEGKWIKALEIAICKAYHINMALDIASQLSFTPRSRYNEIKSLIQNESVPSIELRNRIV